MSAIRYLVLLTLAGVFACPAFAEDEPKKKTKKPSTITIGKDTTRITEPLDERGYVDYVAAINQHASRRVTPKNNAAVLLWQAYGRKPLKDLEPKTARRFYKMLGVPEPAADAGHYSSLDDFLEQHAPKIENAEAKKAALDARDSSMDSPWLPKQHPLLDAWLRENDRALELAKLASRRTRCYTPLLNEGGEPATISILLNGLSEQRDLARMLATRAMRSTAEGKVDAAWTDLLTCWRLARLYSQEPTLIHGLVGIAVESVAAEGTAQFVHHAKLTDAQLTAMRADLKKLPPRGSMADKLDVSERYGFIDCVQSVERGGTDIFKTLRLIQSLVGVVGDAPAGASSTLQRLLMRVAIDWNYVLRDGNTRYDRLVAATRLPRAKRDKAFDAVDREIEGLKKRITDPKTIAAEMLSGKTPRRIASERLSGIFAALLMPALRAVIVAEDRANMLVEMTDAALALRQYRNTHGKYPEKLAALVPKYIKAIPADIHSESAPIHYQRSPKGYVLYGFGKNNEDDGGPNDSDDLGFRVPAKE